MGVFSIEDTQGYGRQDDAEVEEKSGRHRLLYRVLAHYSILVVVEVVRKPKILNKASMLKQKPDLSACTILQILG